MVLPEERLMKLDDFRRVAVGGVREVSLMRWGADELLEEVMSSEWYSWLKGCKTASDLEGVMIYGCKVHIVNDGSPLEMVHSE